MSSDLNAGRATAKQRRDERAILEALYAHQYDTAKKGSKPDDPGWHACSCGWEGYWCNWQPHLADVLNGAAAALVESLSVERDRLREAVQTILPSIRSRAHHDAVPTGPAWFESAEAVLSDALASGKGKP